MLNNIEFGEGVKKSEQTRQRILQAGFEEMYEYGFQGMRIESILKKTKLAKGALYHHFPNKKSLGYAIVDEILGLKTISMLELLKSESDPIEGNCKVLMCICDMTTDKDVSLGCPLNNLSQEMSGLDEGFKQRLCHIYTNWSDSISGSLKLGQEQGVVRVDINSETAAGFIISSFQGITGAAKCMGDKQVMVRLTAVLCDYIRTLRA